ncbi:MAG: metalloregulator ArsR/SmtB family transcription factor [Planctomycetota bacterium]|nr:metalloregulator ArsR/SmtB family transcription factor [Planctomycetota bacterium]
MSKQTEKDLVQVFKLLSDETRLRIIMHLVHEEELHVTGLCDRLNISQPAVSHHLALLRVSGLIDVRREGKHNFYSVQRRYFHHVMGELFKNIAEPAVSEERYDRFMMSHDSDGAEF